LHTLFVKIKNYFSQNNVDDSKLSKYVDLAPTDKADESGVYSRALNYATKNSNVFNIALTGPYGSGKSSIIKTFLKSYNKPTLKISLAAFLPNSNKDETEITKQEIERSILQQMLYGVEAKKLPLSRFKRIQSPVKWSTLVSLYVMIGLSALWYLIQKSTDIVNGSFFIPLNYSNGFNLLALLVGLVFSWQILHQIYIKSFGISLKSISLKDIEITPDATDKESILNRHLDEIIYFFQSTDYELVVIEDLDRFNNPDIFVTLREINGLINANLSKARTVRFLYALRDDMFLNTDRTKFFEFIIPVIPIINTSNSIDKVLEQGERLSLNDRIDRQFLREVSRYLNDLRLIQNIFNEYLIYIENLEPDGSNKLNSNKLLAVLIYKNLLPSDFEELHRGKGKLAEILNRHGEFLFKAETDLKSQITQLEELVSIAEKQMPSDLGELRKIYAMTLLSKIPYHYFQSNINFNGTVFPFNNLSNHPAFDTIFESNLWNYRTQQGHNDQVNITAIENEVNPNKTYQQRKQEIESKSAESKEITTSKIRELRAKISNLRLTKFNEILRTHSKENEELFNAFGENKELLRFLVLEGYLDDSYYQYTSLFHKGRLSQNDNKYLITIRSFINPEPDFPIDNPKEVIAEMRDTDFEQNYVLNKSLADCFFSAPVEYQAHIKKLVKFISSNFEDCETFFSIYYETGEHIGELLRSLFDGWNGFIIKALASSQNKLHVARIMAHLPEKNLKKLVKSDPKFIEYIDESLSDILALGIDFDPNRLKLLQLNVNNLTSLKTYTAIHDLLAEEGMYQISIQNIEAVFIDFLNYKRIVDLRTKHYTTVLNSKNQNLIDKIEQEFDFYLENILLELEQNSEEEVSTIIKAINHEDVNPDSLQEFLEKQSNMLPSFEGVPENHYSRLIKLQKIEPKWENCLKFLVSDVFEPELLTEYLKQKEPFEILSKVSLPVGTEAQPLRKFIFENEDFSGDEYRSYIRVLPNQFNKFPDELNLEKWQIIVEERKITFTANNVSILDGHNETQLLFVIKNIDKYLEIASEISVGDDFRELLLKSNITDDNKLKVIEAMDLSLLTGLPARAILIGEILNRTKNVVKNLDEIAAKTIITSAATTSKQISLFNDFHVILSKDKVRDILQSLPDPFCQIITGKYSIRLSKSPENLHLVEWLQSKKIISSWNVVKTWNFISFDEEIKINLFRK